MMPPNILIIPSDQNELEFVRIIKLKTGNLYEYKFTKSETKLGMLMTFSEIELQKGLKNEIFTEI